MNLKEYLFGQPFDPRSTKIAILAMAHLRPHEILTINSKGQMERVKKRFWRKEMGVRERQMIRYHVFSHFCHPLKNPLDRTFLRLVHVKTVSFAKRALAGIEPHIDLEEHKRLSKIILSYDKISLMQERILKRVTKITAWKKRGAVLDALAGLKSGKDPIRPSHSASGAYFMPGVNLTVAGVFKPFDEEIGGPNNPKHLKYRGPLGKVAGYYKTVVGESLFREIAAYEIDRKLGLGIVPPTTAAVFEHSLFYDNFEGSCLQARKKKYGSFQEYRAGFYHIYEISEKGLESISLDGLQRMVILDILIGNLDRNISNLLTNGHDLVAIDHGFCLSPSPLRGLLLRSFYILPQLQQPFLPFLRKKVEELNIETLMGYLRKHCYINQAALDRMHERLEVLKASMRQGLSVRMTLHLLQPRFMRLVIGYKKTLPGRAKHLVTKYASPAYVL